MDASPAPRYDPLSPEAVADPHVFYRGLRETGTVQWHEVLGAWVVTGYEECRRVLADTAGFGSDFRRAGEDVPDAMLSIQSLDPPDHGAVRHLLVNALHVQSPASMAAHVTDIAAAGLRTLLAERGEIDFVGRYARPVALRTMCDFLGVTAPEGAAFEATSNAVVRSMDAGLDPGRGAPGLAARRELTRLVGTWLDEAPPDGFLGAAERMRQEEGTVSRAVLENSMRGVLHSGYESVSRLMGNAMARLATTPGLLDRAEAAQALDTLVDELVRLETPVQADARVCVAERVLGGHRIPRGDVVLLFLAAANRDPAVFPAPDSVGLERRRGLHLTFGRGAHACLGAAFASMQLRAVLEACLRAGVRFEAVRPPVYEPTATLRGLSELTLTARRAEAARPQPAGTA
ncbi:cytochrome P450 [Streptomyces sp. NPDC059740]|uniref:cytochrome P450 n=1 Tax=Streptomyces sp. NPDC059740 TaxID=3346926 RepID=UPI00366901CF